MSSGSGGTSRGRGRGSGPAAPPSTRGNARGRGTSNGARRGNTTARGGFGQATSMAAGQSSQNGFNVLQGNPFKQQPAPIRGSQAQNGWQDRYAMMKKLREQERRDAIRHGLMADPDKPRSLADAITPVGTCQDMCPEFERVQRVAQDDVWNEEMDPNITADTRGPLAVDESRMVKKFRRSAAGYEEQLPSDLRPPSVLRKTCDYLFNEVIGNALSLAKVHHFVWDRTRAIRNDLSIQQLTKADDVQIAIDCYERIARFHILSLHQFALAEKPYEKYDSFQEREQLDRALLSLIQYYDDSRGRIELRNEAEFRAYCIIFQLQDPTPDLENRIQSWPPAITQHPKVLKALQIYTAACNTVDPKGPLKPSTPQLVARQNWEFFWDLIATPGVSYLMGCVAEIYFSLVRRMVLKTILRTSRPSRGPAVNSEWTINELMSFLRLDREDQVAEFCGNHGLHFHRGEDGVRYLDLSSAGGKNLPASSIGPQPQLRSSLVERKRHGRKFFAVINGLTVHQAQSMGLVADDEAEMEEDGMMSAEEDNEFHNIDEDPQGQESDSLFIPENTQSRDFAAPEAAKGPNAPTVAPASIFGAPKTGFSFGMPSASKQIPPANGLGFSFTPTKPPDPEGLSTADKTSAFKFMPTTSADEASIPKPVFGSSPFAFSTAGGNNASGQGNTEAKPTSFAGLPSLTSPFAVVETPVAPESGAPSFLTPKPQTANSDTAARSSAFSFTSPFSFPPKSTAQPPASTSQPAPTTSPVSPSTSIFQTTAAGGSASTPFSISNVDTSPATIAAPETAPKHVTPSFSALVEPNSNAQQTTQSGTGTSSAAATSSNFGPAKGTSAERLRSASVSGDHRPKSPSPLAQSFTASEDTPSFAAKQHPKLESLSAKRSETVQTSTPPTKTPEAPTPVVETPESIIARLADELTFDPIAGFLKQYLDFSIGRVVTAAQEKIYTERVNREADDFRQFCLALRYGKRWREGCRHQRLAKQARERRRRAHRRIQDAESGSAFDTASALDSASVLGSSTATSIAGGRKSRRELIDEMFRATLNESTPLRDRRANPGSKRSAATYTSDALELSDRSVQKRLKSTSHVDGQGRVGKPTPTKNSTTDHLQRSSFLGFSLRSGAGVPTSTTKSPYFRMKALGLKPTTSLNLTRSRKRSRSRSIDEDTASISTQTSTSPRMNEMHKSINTGLMLPPPPKISKTQVRNDDEALFARLKAARASLKESEGFMKDEMAKEDDFQRSMSSQSSGGDSPSMARARIEARMRASRAGSEMSVSTSDREVPAYRLRQSRFVPREDYHRAIERANEVRASRSREVSRPASRTEGSVSEPLEVSKDNTGSPLRFASSATDSGQPASVFAGFSRLNQGVKETNNSFGFNVPSSGLHAPQAAKAPTFGFGQASQSSPLFSKRGNNSNTTFGFGGSASTLAPSTQLFSDAQSGQSVNGQHTVQGNPLATAFSFSQYAQPMSTPGTELDSGVQPRVSTTTADMQDHPDHTIPRSQIDSALHHSFGQRTSNEEVFKTESRHPEASFMNGVGEPKDEHDLHASYGHANPYAALADREEYASGEDVNDAEDALHGGVQNAGHYREDNEYGFTGFKGGRQHDPDDEMIHDEDEFDSDDDSKGENRVMQGHGYDQEAREDGDIEDFDEYEGEDEEEEEEGDAYDGEMYEEEEYDEFNPSDEQQSMARNPELQDVGGTVEEAIELSD